MKRTLSGAGNTLQAVAAALVLCAGCSAGSGRSDPESTATNNNVHEVPDAVAAAIGKKFPGAVQYKKGIDSLLSHLKDVGIPAGTILWGQSTCVDDIINTKNKPTPEIKGPFNFGGLAGLPFTGVSGLNAFAHHVPEEGTALLFVAPHIGYGEKGGWGKILRHSQNHESTCCGALAAALDQLKAGKPGPGEPQAGDYQEDVIRQLVYHNSTEILSAPEPLVALTRITYKEAVKQLSEYAAKVKERHFRYAVVAGGVIINTDYMYPDYVWINHVSIFDVRRNEWVEGHKPE